jgi:two-component system cell cycle sensor histidine kinase/response regulator CckA
MSGVRATRSGSWPRWTLRRQLLVFTLAVAAPLLVLVGLGAQELSAQAASNARAEAANLAGLAARHVAEELDELQDLAATLASRPRVRALDPAGCDPLLADLVQLDPQLLNALTVRADAAVVCSVRHAAPDARVSDASVALDGRPSDVFWGRFSHRHLSVVAVPLRSPSGADGALRLVLDLEAFAATFRDLAGQDGTRLYVMDAAGTVVTGAGNASVVGRRASELGLPGAASARIGVEQVAGGDGRDHVVARVPVRGTRWVAVATIPAERAFAAAEARTLRSAFGAALALAAMLLAAGLLGARITRPVAAVAATARAMRLGDDAARAPVRGPREFAEVARELNAALDARRETEAVRAASEESLRASERRHREIAELVSDLALSWRVAPDGRFEREWSTERLDRFLGVTPVDGFDAQVRAALHPEDAAALDEARARLVREACTIEYDLRWRRAVDGAWRWVRHTSRSIHESGPDGPRVRILLSGEDVTDDRDATRARDDRLAWEELAAAISRRFLAAVPQRLDAELAPALEQLRAFLGLDRVVLQEVRLGGSRTLAWARGEGVPDAQLEARAADFPATTARLRAGGAFAFSHLDALAETAPRDAPAYRRIGMQAALLQPLHAAGAPVGVLFLSSVKPRTWSEEEIRRTASLAELFANAVSRMVADRALRQSEKRYRSVVENAGDAIFVADADTGVLVEANPRAAELAGLSQEALVGRHHTALYPAEDRAAADAAFLEQAITPGPPNETRICRADGRLVPVEISAALFTEGNERRLLGIFRDLSERRRAEEETRQLKEFYAAILENVREGILVTDAADRIQYVNRAQTRAFGVPRERLLGTHVADEAPSGVDPEVPTQYDRARRTLEPAPYEARSFLADGREVLQSGWFVPLVRAGAYDGMVCTAEDVTERRAVEETLRSTQEQFLQSQKMEAVGRLAGGVAHDFNNILSVILSYAELLQDELPSQDPRRADLDEVVNAARAGASLTRQLLAFSRKQVTEPRVVRLGELVTGAQRLLKRLIGEDVALEVSGADGPWRVRIDPGHLEQVLLNLAVNARDAMPGGGRLAIAVGAVALEAPAGDAGERSGSGRWVTLSVTDTGCGMDEATRAHVFEPFFTTKSAGQGTGLGLATVYGIVQQAGGHVAVESAPGRGAVFRISLPETDADGPTADEAPRAPAPDLPRARTDELVLIVEDDPALRQVMQRVLAGAGYHVLAAASGDEALRIAATRRERIQLLVSDVVMPGMNGRDLATRLAAARPELRTLFLSGYTDDILGAHGVLDAGTHLLHKPFTQVQLLEAVRRRLAA